MMETDVTETLPRMNRESLEFSAESGELANACLGRGAQVRTAERIVSPWNAFLFSLRE
jgi:hypothetical protein